MDDTSARSDKSYISWTSDSFKSPTHHFRPEKTAPTVKKTKTKTKNETSDFVLNPATLATQTWFLPVVARPALTSRQENKNTFAESKGSETQAILSSR